MNNLQIYDDETYPKKTNTACFYCCHTFNNRPLPMPFKFINGNFYVKYTFCSWECMKSYNNDSNFTYTPKIFSLISLLYQFIYGKVDVIKFAPPKSELQLFGGSMSIDDFRKNNIKINYYKIPYPYVICSDNVQKINFSFIDKNKADDQFNNFTHKSNNNENNIKLKRQTPIKNTNTLESIMGVIKK